MGSHSKKNIVHLHVLHTRWQKGMKIRRCSYSTHGVAKTNRTTLGASCNDGAHDTTQKTSQVKAVAPKYQ